MPIFVVPLAFWNVDAAGSVLLVVPGVLPVLGVVTAPGVEAVPAVAATVGVGTCTTGCGVELKLPLV